MSLFDALQNFATDNWLILFALIGISVVITTIAKIARLVSRLITMGIVFIIIVWVMINVTV